MLKVFVGIIVGMAIVISPIVYVFNRPAVKNELKKQFSGRITELYEETIFGKKPAHSPYRKYSDIN